MNKALPVAYQAEVIEKGQDIVFNQHDGWFFIYGGKDAFSQENDPDGRNAYAFATRVAERVLNERDIVCCGVRYKENDGRGNFQFIVLNGPECIVGVNVFLQI